MNAEVNKRTQCAWRKTSGVLSGKMIPKDPQDDSSASYDVRDGDSVDE